MAYPHWVSSQYQTVTGTSAKFATAMTNGTVYVLSVTTPTWFLVGATGASATVGAGSHFLGSGGLVEISPSGDDEFVHMIKDTGAADGRASLSAVTLP